MRFVAAFILAAVGWSASADCPYDCTLSWVFPTQRVNGDALTVAELNYVDIYCDDGGGGGYQSIARINPPTTVLSFAASAMPPGSYSCYATVTDTGLNESASSNTVGPFVQSTAPPGPLILQQR